MRFLVKHNFTAYRPHKWAGDYVRRFGDRNQGFYIQAKSPKDAESLLKTEYNLNPFYLTIIPEY